MPEQRHSPRPTPVPRSGGTSGPSLGARPTSHRSDKAPGPVNAGRSDTFMSRHGVSRPHNDNDVEELDQWFERLDDPRVFRMTKTRARDRKKRAAARNAGLAENKPVGSIHRNKPTSGGVTKPGPVQSPARRHIGAQQPAAQHVTGGSSSRQPHRLHSVGAPGTVSPAPEKSASSRGKTRDVKDDPTPRRPSPLHTAGPSPQAPEHKPPAKRSSFMNVVLENQTQRSSYMNVVLQD